MEAAQLEAAQVLSGHTRISVPHKAHADAMEELQELGTHLKSAFAKLVNAQDQLAELGISISVELPTPLNKAWSEYQASHALETDLNRK
jgi:hypothetical protein